VHAWELTTDQAARYHLRLSDYHWRRSRLWRVEARRHSRGAVCTLGILVLVLGVQLILILLGGWLR
jgi:hypothetical protein